MKKIIFFSILSVICRICTSENLSNNKCEPINNIEDSQLSLTKIVPFYEYDQRLNLERIIACGSPSKLKLAISEPAMFFVRNGNSYKLRIVGNENILHTISNDASMIKNFSLFAQVVKAGYTIAGAINSEAILRVTYGTSADGQDEKEKELLSLLTKHSNVINRDITFEDCFESGLFFELNSEKWQALISKIGENEKISIKDAIIKSIFKFFNNLMIHLE